MFFKLISQMKKQGAEMNNIIKALCNMVSCHTEDFLNSFSNKELSLTFFVLFTSFMLQKFNCRGLGVYNFPSLCIVAHSFYLSQKYYFIINGMTSCWKYIISDQKCCNMAVSGYLSVCLLVCLPFISLPHLFAFLFDREYLGFG